jgi:hypothetical protein
MKKFKLLVGAMALFALAVVNVWNAATSLNVSELDIYNVESIVAEGDVNSGTSPELKCNVTFWRIWGDERADRSGWKKKECESGCYYYDERCTPGDRYAIYWGAGGCPFELMKRFWCYGTN